MDLWIVEETISNMDANTHNHLTDLNVPSSINNSTPPCLDTSHTLVDLWNAKKKRTNENETFRINKF